MASHIRRTNRCQMLTLSLPAGLPATLPAASISLPAPLARLRAYTYMIYLALWSIGERICRLNRIFSLLSGRMPWPRSERRRSLRKAFACGGGPGCGLGEPALAAPVVLEVEIGLTGADFVEPEIELLDVGVLPQGVGRALEYDAAVLHDVAVVGDVERHGGVLLDQEHGQAALFAQPVEDAEDLVEKPRRPAERGLVEQDHL